MKYLITGGAGFIGSHLSDALIKRGDSVVVLDNLSTGTKRNIEHLIGDNSFELVEGSILDVDLVESVVSKVDHVLHLAAAVGVFNIVDKPLDSLITNIRGTENILETCLAQKKPVLIASSSEIYGKNGGEPLNEESDRIIGSPLKSRWSYSEAKAIDESMAYFYHREKGLEVRIVRFFNTVGPRQSGDYGMVIPRFIEAALKNQSIQVYGDGKQTRCFCHVSDAVRAVLTILNQSESVGQVFNIGNSEEVSILDLAHKVKTITNSGSEIELVPYSDAYAAGFEDMQRRVPDITKIREFSGWQPKRILDEIIVDVANSLRN
jgi:UDP-glucose 4-epimerase